MHTQTITAPATHALNAPHAPVSPPADQFSIIASCSGVIAIEFSYRKDEEIYGEGEPSEYVYQVIRGAVRTYKLLTDGRRQIGAFHLAGDVFGLDPGTSHRLTAEAITDTTVRLVKRRSLETAAGSNIRVAHNLWTMTASDLRHAEDHMLLLGRKTAMEKVATFLLEMDRRLANAGMMALPMCRRDIGDYLGLTLETVSRALSQLNEQGILVFSSARQIVLRNRQRLADMDA
ncbi:MULTISPECIES: helix-turn-helix domain-containing protein [Bradyrhizobium]|jgi:CRP/FNR family nitrogen fixation transcriptional regulator|uniref:Transcriptional regulator, Crp/Fnr family n=2 Tax=Bradyrhizobium TaxID=374 RepID=A0ABY0QG35_9BRAD|nr:MULTISPECIES: helix-turn-helix domain-containing protein [Bradyrhizobium]SDK26163.1 transcriptional regulator, Crp/Fnr family [Bradyrhizobium ottawaense]SEE43688.1 transcriptional regulator, Crp/Fnr family [Bradyrhizobium lablabi]SHM42783.1 transcriptional regulator, Crp/Fnr family [Bradyrhizobium lablabi]